MKFLNKYFVYILIGNFLIMILAGLLQGVPGDCIPFWIAILILNGTSFFCVSGWRRWIIFLFFILGLFLLKGEIVGSHQWREKKKQLIERINANTNSSILNTNK